jgi:hypothetical protein
MTFQTTNNPAYNAWVETVISGLMKRQAQNPACKTAFSYKKIYE